MKSDFSIKYRVPVLLLAAVMFLATTGLSSLWADEGLDAIQSAPLFIAGGQVEVNCSFVVPDGRNLESLLWKPSLPAGFTLVPDSVTGDGTPEIDFEGNIVFFGDLSAIPIEFSYWINVPVDATGDYDLGGEVDYALDGMFNPETYVIPVATLSDASASHEVQGYLAGERIEIECSFSYSAGRQLESLLWKPELPADWTLVSATGDGDPQADSNWGDITFFGNLSENPIVFKYTVEIPAGTKGSAAIGGEIEYTLNGMFNPSVIRAQPDPLEVLEMHTLEIVSAYGEVFPPVGVYTNYDGVVLTNTGGANVTIGSRTFACSGWNMTGNEPLAGIGTDCVLTLTNNTVLIWTWVAPLITPAGSVDVTMDEDNAPVSWVQPGVSAVTTSTPAGEPAGSLTWSLRSQAAHGVAQVSGTGSTPTINYQPLQDYFGPDSFEVQVEDGLGGVDWITVNVTVEPVNDPPVLAPIGDQRTDERTTLTFTAAAADVDVPSQVLTFTLDAASIAEGMSIDPVTGDFTWTPSEGQAGADFTQFSVTVTVSDNGTYPDNQIDSETFTITLDSSRATHTTVGYVDGQPLTIDCTFAYPENGRQLQSLLWRPELPDGWELVSASGDGDPMVDDFDNSIVFFGSDLPSHNPVSFSYVVNVPAGATGPQSVGGEVDYLLDDMANPATIRAQPDPLVIPMLLSLPDLEVADKVYNGLTNATVLVYGAFAGLEPGHDVQLVTSNVWAYFDTPDVGVEKPVTVGGFVLTGADASLYSIDIHVVTAAVTEAELTVTADPQSKTYGDPNPPLTFQYDGFVNGEDSSVLDVAPTVSTTVTQFTGAGTHEDAITVSGGIDNNYAFTYVSADFTILPKAASVQAEPKTRIYAQPNPELTAIVTGTVNGDTIDYILSTTAVLLSDVGEYPIAVTLGTNPNYDVTTTDSILTITKADATIVVNGTTVEYDGNPHGATGNAMSADGVSDLSHLLDLGATFVNVPGGVAAWSFAGDINHNPANGTVQIEIKQKPASVTPDPGQTKVYGAADPELTGTTEGFLPADNVTASFSRVAGEDVGSYTISATLDPAGVLGNYDITYNTAEFTITALTINVTADPQTKVYGEADPALTYTYDPELVAGDAFAGELERDPGETVGTYAINQGTLVLNSNYTINYISADFGITAIYIRGTVFNDLDRLTDGVVDGVGTNAGGLFVNLVEASSSLVIASVAVSVEGTYALSSLDGVEINSSYKIILSVDQQAAGASLVEASLPATWVSTGEHVGDGAGDDGTVDGVLPVATANSNVHQVNFGIIRVPNLSLTLASSKALMKGVDSFFMLVQITEVNAVDSDGTIIIRVQKDSRWILDGQYNPELESFGATALDNSEWSYSENSTQHIFTRNKVIPGSGVSYLGFSAIWDAGQAKGTVSVTAQIDVGSGGDHDLSGNIDVENLTYIYE